jgi:hypothetical protein
MITSQSITTGRASGIRGRVKKMATIENLNILAALEWEEDYENVDGFVAEIPSSEEKTLNDLFSSAGYETSISMDIEGRSFLWVMGGA